MLIKESKYVGSFPDLAHCPAPQLPEYAFIGRSNVGKSSLINMLCQKKDLAHVSKKPGKTKMINYFLINEEWHLVDLPGYGYAKRSKKEKALFSDMIADYLVERPSLQCAFVLLDINVPSQEIDIEFVNWMGEKEIPFVIVFTKSDKLTTHKRNQQMALITKAVGESWHSLPQQFCSSSVTNTGRDEILDFIEQVNLSIA